MICLTATRLSQNAARMRNSKLPTKEGNGRWLMNCVRNAAPENTKLWRARVVGLDVPRNYGTQGRKMCWGKNLIFPNMMTS